MVGNNGLRPYYLFEGCGERFAFHLGTQRFIQLTPLAYAYLELRLSMPHRAALDALRRQNGHSEEELGLLGKEFAAVAGEDFFSVPDYRIPGEELERQLVQRYAVLWTRLELALAETCNLACKYCYCSSCRDMENQGLMSEVVARKAIDWLFMKSGNAKELGITLFGGEPLLNRDVFQFVMEYSDARAKETHKTIRYTMTTNGTLLDDMAIHYIKKHNFGLMVSLDGPPEIHDAQCPFRDGRGSFDAAAAGIKRLMKRRKRVTVRCTMSNRRPRMVDLIRFFEEFGFSRIVLGRVVSPVRPTPLDCTEDTLAEFSRQEETEVLEWIFDEFKAGRKPKYFPYDTFIRERAKPREGEQPGLSIFRCGACRGTMTVGADGRLYPCHRYVGMQQFVIGDIDTGPDIEKAKDYWRRYYHAIRSRCESCWARTLCEGPCPWEISSADGEFVNPHRHCAYTYRYYHRAAYVHYRLQRELPEIYSRHFGQETTPAQGRDSEENNAAAGRADLRAASSGSQRAATAAGRSKEP